jgi:anti-sigma factor RsiW
MTELSDELLVAYVDGQLARKQSSAVEKVLAHDDVIARRVAALKDAHRRLEAAFEAILAGEEADAAAQPLPRAPGLFIARDTLIKGGVAAAGIVVALVLILAGYGWPLAAPEFASDASGPADPEHVGSLPHDWQEEVARAQALLSRASLEMGLDSQGNREFIGFHLGHAIGAALTPPDLAPQGFRFARAQLLSFGGEPLAQLLYLGTSGAPVALYAKKGESSATPQFKQYGGIAGVAWSRDGVAYLLAGERDEASLLLLAEAIRSGQEIGNAAAAPHGSPPAPPPSPARP